jgi:chromosome segregation and condensation protein ScpB
VNIVSSHRRTKRSTDTPAAVAAKAVVQILFATGKSLTVDGLREKLREFHHDEVCAEIRAVAALTNVELISALLECNRQLEPVGLQLRIVNGVVSFLTTKIESRRLADYLRAQTGASGNPDLTTAALEILACIAFKQPVSQAEIDRIFAADKRGLVVKLRDLGLVADFAGDDGRLRFATTEAFLRRLNLASLEELQSVFSGPPALGEMRATTGAPHCGDRVASDIAETSSDSCSRPQENLSMS